LNIAKANLTISTSNVSKTYDAGTTALGTAVKAGGLTSVSADTLSGGTFAFTDHSVGNGNKTVTTTGVTINDGNNGDNYNVTYEDNTGSTISNADVAVTGLTPLPSSAAKAQPAATNGDDKNDGSKGSQKSLFRDPVYGGIQVSPNGGIKLASDMLFSGESEQFALDDQ
jgi:hypothetical protein